jgi:FRG domain
MQHHGAPTRFLDWTKSPYVAAYFAFEEKAQREENHSAVWAINLDWLENRGRELLPSNTTGPISGDPQTRVEWINSLLAQSEEAVISRADPLKGNERMAAQQGVFLCKLFHNAAFSQTLMRMMIHPETPDRPAVRKLEVRAKCRKDFLTNLRAMNIHRASLFPGLDGFAWSLKLDLEMR